MVANSGLVHSLSKLIMPSQDCILEIRGARSSGVVVTCGILSTGKPVESFDFPGHVPTAAQRPSIWRKMNFGTIMTLVTIAGVLLKPRQRL